MRRAAAVWLVLFAAYAATIGLHAFGTSQFGGDEPHYLLTAESIVSDRDVDLRDEYARARTATGTRTSSSATGGSPTARRTSRTGSAFRC